MTIALNKAFRIPTDEITRTNRIILMTTIFIVIIGLFPNFYSWQMTATGMLLSGFIPPDTTLIQSEGITLILAAVIQLGIFLLFNLIPVLFKCTNMRWWSKSISFIVLIFFLSALILVSWGYSLFSTTLNSVGGEIALNMEGKVENYFQSLKNIDQQIIGNYQKHLNNLTKMANQAAQGKDGTNIARCGSICNGFLRNRLRLSQKYLILSSQSVSSLFSYYENKALPVVLDAINQNEYPDILAKVKHYKHFLLEIGAADDISIQLEQLIKQKSELTKKIDSSSSNQQDLLIDYIKEQLNRLWQGDHRFNSTLVFSLVMAVIPDIVNLSLIFCIFIIMHIDAAVFVNRKRKIQVAINP